MTRSIAVKQLYKNKDLFCWIEKEKKGFDQITKITNSRQNDKTLTVKKHKRSDKVTTLKLKATSAKVTLPVWSA